MGIHTQNLILLQLRAEVCVDISKQFNWLIDNVVGGNKHRLPQILQPNKVNFFSDKASSPGNQPTLIDVHHTEETIKAPKQMVK